MIKFSLNYFVSDNGGEFINNINTALTKHEEFYVEVIPGYVQSLH